MLMKEGVAVKIGSYQDIIQTGFNIKDILDSFNQALKNKSEDEPVKKFEKD